MLQTMWLYLTLCAVLPVSAFGGSEGVSTTSTSNGCTYKKSDQMYFFSAKFKTLSNIEDIDQCVLKCWKYKIGGTHYCKAVNYIISDKSCEFLHQPFDVNNQILVNYYGYRDPNSIYAVPVSCPANDAVTTTVSSNNDMPSVPISDTSSICGKTDIDPMATKRSYNRIVNGEEAKPHSIPWIISVRCGYTPPRPHKCGATLIDIGDPNESDIVITAAHCLPEFIEDNIEMMAGGHNQKETEGTQMTDYEDFVGHTGFEFKTMENDIALIKLKDPIKFGPHIQPACLPAAGEIVPDGTEGLVSGWGTLKHGVDKPYHLLQQLVVPIVNSEKCLDLYKNEKEPKFTNATTMLCAGHVEGGKDSCQGDSGGPLFFKNSKGLYTLQGVVSYGKGCARENMAGVYVRVSNYVDWIKDKVQKMSSVVGNKVNMRG